MTEHGPKLHATLGASSCYRWWECPGSVRLTANLKDEGSDFAAEGTAAHALGEDCLTHGRSPDEFLGSWICSETEVIAPKKPDALALKKFRWFEVTDEMIEAVQIYVDAVRADFNPDDGDILMVEQKFDLGVNFTQMFGTADAVIYKSGARSLHVFDLKYGRGVPVEARTGSGTGIESVNRQALYYALGATLALPPGKPVTSVEVVIVQPRAPHKDGPVRRATVDAYELLEWRSDVLAAARRTLEPDAPLAAGSWCKFCGAAGFCPKLREQSLENAMSEFSDDLSELTPDEIARILNAAEDVENWIKAVRAYAYQRLEQGDAVPGWKLVPKRATRKWAEDEETTAEALRLLGLDDGDLFKKSLLTPAQVEKLMSKDDREALAALTVKESSGSTMARESDERGSVPGRRNAQDEFND
ncbi:protein of unknown function(Protein of unknown function DUF2800,9-401) [Magnetospirillum sp. XM-1]|uniref:DUF2800 domain-containing protein n=1 Tax=Magnetospirillum sp. XM-1 TaxID=1663591 RepID=UPI00073DBA42|nr:DUF2800 domain-containing protein [Magnetospirillum sp. XM-1]CUW38822.1 protein of unknown function(Protein of unknown function DUF2800,9-401) [Magnetospirillum sp. XM-1]